MIRQNDGQFRALTDAGRCIQCSIAKLIAQAGFRRAINDRACGGMIRSGARPAWVPGCCAGRGYPTPRCNVGGWRKNGRPLIIRYRLYLTHAFCIYSHIVLLITTTPTTHRVFNIIYIFIFNIKTSGCEKLLLLGGVGEKQGMAFSETGLEK